MKMISWRGIRLHIQSHNVQVGSQQLELRRCYRNSGGPPVLMVAGFLNTIDVFLPRKGEGGLAPFLASLGYDVYLAELRGRGSSWPAISGSADWGLHEAICEDIPAHLQMIQKLRPGEAQYWLGEGLGSLLLAASFARLSELPVPVLGMIHIAAFRRFSLESKRQSGPYRSWSLLASLASLFCGHVTLPLSDPRRRETRRTLAAWKHWHNSEEWLDPRDGFDYGQALRSLQLPPSLYVANRESALWGSAADCRQWVKELGPHDGRLVTVSKQGGNQRNYSHMGLLRHPGACDDHFVQLQAWLEEASTQCAAREPASVE